LRFVKGHGTENDFVLLPDPDGALDPTPGLVRALCDRRAGIGADGVLRVVPTEAVDEVAALAAQAAWFMDYRNADGGAVEMCGNGIRVFARYLVAAGLAPAGAIAIATRDGVKQVTVRGPNDDVIVDMGEAAPLDLGDVWVAVDDRRYLATTLSMGNPHAVVPVADLAEAGALTAPPVLDPPDAFPDGVNVEFVLGRGPGRIAMRVHERGVGETRSCGTGACAAAVAAAGWWADPGPLRCLVEVPGGTLLVTRRPDGHVELSGNAVLVASGEVDTGWLGAASAAVPVGAEAS
jgi:diaminopimelate epimerase